MTRPIRYALLAAGLAALVGCQNGPPTIFGYQLGADALYDPNVKTVYVPVFANTSVQTTPYQGLEVSLTRAVVKEIGARTRFKVVPDPDRADTELLGSVIEVGKLRVNANIQNLTREAELVVSVDVLWRDLRDGRVLSAPRKGRNPATGGRLLADPAAVPFDPTVPAPPPAAVNQSALPVRLVGVGRVITELGESSTTAEQRAVKDLAGQIVSMMEKPW